MPLEGSAAGQGLRGSSDIHAFGDSNLYLRRGKDHLVLSTEHRAAPASAPIHLALIATNPETIHLEVIAPHQDGERHAVSRSKCSTSWPQASCSRGRSSAIALRSRMSAWARCSSRSSAPAGCAARPRVGNAWTDRPEGSVPVPPIEKRGNGTMSMERGTSTETGSTVPGVDFNALRPKSRWSRS